MSSPNQESFSLSHSSSGCEQSNFDNYHNSVNTSDLPIDEDPYSNDDYVDMTSDSPDDDQSIDENYKEIKDEGNNIKQTIMTNEEDNSKRFRELLPAEVVRDIVVSATLFFNCHC